MRLLFWLVLCVACTTDTSSTPGPDVARKRSPPTPVCGPEIDLISDPANCGTCGTVCSSHLCYAGVCADAVAGHVFAIGHGYASSTPSLDRLLGNAAFLNDRAQIRILAYAGYSNTTLVDGANAAIDREATRRGRTTTKTVVTNSADVQVLIDAADVFLVYAEPLADSQYLYFLGDEWSIPIDNFARSGGVIIVLDGPSTNAGTAEVLRRPGLMDLGPHLTANGLGHLADPTDIIASRVTMVLDLDNSSSGWSQNALGATVIMTDDSQNAVVLHRAIY